MKHVIEDLRFMKDVRLEKIEMLELHEYLSGKSCEEEINLEKEKVAEIEKAITILILHEGVLNFMAD